jgi:penicillin-binding protein 1C
VKTGTSKDMRDNWCVGYSERYTVGVWVGNFSGSPMWNVSGVSGAAPIWLEIMNELHRDLPGNAPAAPDGVSPQTIIISDRGRVDKKQEWFIKGTEQLQVLSRFLPERPKIIYPAPGTIIAVDPDIPEGLQKVFFETSTTDAAQRLVLDDVELGAAPVAAWLPVPGMHSLSLRGQDGAVEDQITFEVR